MVERIEMRMVGRDSDTIEVIMPSEFVPTNYDEYVDEDGRLFLPKHLARLLYAEVLLLTASSGVDVELKLRNVKHEDIF